MRHLYSQPATFISAVLLVTSTMLRLALPHVNVLSKIDLLPNYSPLPFNLDFFTEMLNLSPLLRYLEGRVEPIEEIERREALQSQRNDAVDREDDDDGDDEGRQPLPSGRTVLQEKFKGLTTALCDVVEDYAMVSFLPLNIEDAVMVSRVLSAVDKANGYSLAMAYAQETKRFYSTNDEKSSAKSEVNDDVDNTVKQLYDYTSELSQVESRYALSLEIQEKYGAS